MAFFLLGRIYLKILGSVNISSSNDLLNLQPWRVHVGYWEIKTPGTFTADSGFPCLCYYYADSKKYVYAIPAHEYPNHIKVT